MEAQLGLNPVNLTDQATVGWAEGLSLSGTYASRPAAGIPNRVYYCTDCDALYQDNGTSWVKIRLGGVGGPPMADPPTTGWTSVNMGTATWVSDKDGMVLTAPSRSMSIGYVYRAYPVGAFSLVTNFYVDLANTTVLPSAGNWWRCGLVISDGTKLETFGPGLYNATSFAAPWYALSQSVTGDQWANTSTYSAAMETWFPPLYWIGAMPQWWRYRYDGTTTHYFEWSINGIDWHTYHQEARTAYLTPTQIGVYYCNLAGYNLILRLRSWSGVA
jgi:hypothetical protein